MIELAKQYIESADAMVILAGAGMSVDSGLPDFRGSAGLWSQIPAAKAAGVSSFQELAKPHWFQDEPALAWGFYGKRQLDYVSVKPHDGYGALLSLAKKMPHGYRVITSNVDGHFQKAGFDHVAEIHGSIHKLQSMDGQELVFYPQDWAPKFDESGRMISPLPRDSYWKIARPRIMMFSDYSWAGREFQEREQEAKLWIRDQHQAKHKVLFIMVGAGDAIASLQYITLSQIHPDDMMIRVDIKERASWVGPDKIPHYAQIIKGAKEALVELAKPVLY